MEDHLSAGAMALAQAAVAAGAVVQGSVGFGFALVAVPALSLLRPEALPVTILFLALPMTSSMALRERRAIDVPGFLWITAGRVVGTAGGVSILVAVPAGSLAVLFGSLVLVAAAFSALLPGVELRGRTRLAAGVASGVMGTAGAVGGPPLALVYRDRPGPVLRSTLALSFFLGLLISLAALGIAGRIEGWQAVLALKLVPGLAAGLLASGLTGRFLDQRWVRPAVLTFAAASGAAAVVQGLAG